MLDSPFGQIEISIDGHTIEYTAVKLPIGRHFYSGATGRYAIRIDLIPDGLEHNIDCRLVGINDVAEAFSESGEDLECMTFRNKESKMALSIACRGESWAMGCTTESLDRGYDYDTVTLPDGIRYKVMPTTKTSEYIFGICWKEGVSDSQNTDTWFGADPNLFGDYCVDPEIGTITCDILLSLFMSGANVDETSFYFEGDPDEQEHYIGYLQDVNPDNPYWVGYCDIDDGCEFATAEELFEARIFDGKSLRERWDSVVLLNIGGLSISDFYHSVPEIRHLFTEGKGAGSIRSQ